MCIIGSQYENRTLIELITYTWFTINIPFYTYVYYLGARMKTEH